MRTTLVDTVENSFGKLVNFTYSSAKDLENALLHTIIQGLKHNKPLLIVCPDQTQKQTIENLITTIGALDLTLSIDKNQDQWEDFLAKCKHKLSNAALNIQIEETTFLEYLQGQNIAILDRYYSFCESKLLHFQNGKNALLYLADLPDMPELAIIQKELQSLDIVGDSKEYELYMQNISDALFLYEKDFELHDSHQYEFAQIAKNNASFFDNYESIAFDLHASLEIAHELRNDYFHEYNELYSQKESILSENCNQCIWKAKELEYKCQAVIAAENNKTKSLLSAFQTNPAKKQTQEIATLCQELLASIPYISIPKDLDFHTQDPHILLANIQNFQTYLQVYQNQIKAQAELWTISANQKNTNSPMFTQLEHRLIQLCQKINDFRICRENYEVNTISFHKQLEFIDKIHSDVEITVNRINQDLPYYKWLSFYQNLQPNSKTIINSLRKTLPSNWLTLFDAWYIKKMYTKTGKPSTKVNAHFWHNYTSQTKKLEEIHNQLTIENALVNRTNALQINKKEDSAFWKQINKNKNIYPHSHRFFDSSAGYISKYFPIVLTSEDDFTLFKEHGYTSLIYVNADDSNVNILQDFETIHVYFSSNHPKAKSAEKSLFGNWDFGQLSFSQLQTSDRFQLSKVVTQALLHIKKIPTIYHLKNASILSYADHNVNALIEDKYRHLGIKQNIVNDSIADTLLTIFMDAERDTLILTENYLLDNLDLNNAVSQLNLLDRLFKLGLLHVNIDYNEVIEHGSDYIRFIFEQFPIKQTNTTKSSRPTSQSITSEA